MEDLSVAVEKAVQVELSEVAEKEQLLKQLSDAQLAYVGGGSAIMAFL